MSDAMTPSLRMRVVEAVADALWKHDADVQGYEYEGFDELPEWSKGMYRERASVAVETSLDILASGERVEPDYITATEEADRLLGKLTAHYADVVAIVDAAVGGRLLVDPPKEEERDETD